jgi:aerobic-type carbon monoxide dehydrogenase small subunit (CoxS/CutS family)
LTVVQFVLNGDQVEVDDAGDSLLDVLRERFVDGSPRVACVTPARRVAGRSVTTLEGLDPVERDRWAEALLATGGSQCGFCTPGIVVRLAARGTADVETALLAHLCRCTGWQTILEAAVAIKGFGDASGPETPTGVSKKTDSAVRASLEGHAAQRVGADIVLGAGGFADDTPPDDALVAVRGADGEWVVAESLSEARRAAGKVQGRRTTKAPSHPLEVPPGAWDLTLRTTWVEPAYLEPDASWCRPGGEPVSPLANGGAFGGKTASLVAATARRLADEHGRAVRVMLSREDTVRLGPKRPPVAAGVRSDGTGVIRVVRTAGIADAIGAVAPGLAVEEVDVPGPPTSAGIRAAGWAEAAILLAALEGRAVVTAPNGGRAEATIDPSSKDITVRVHAGWPLDETVLRSYAIGAAHMGLSWVTSEGLFVDDDGDVHDLTIRSFGILRARDMPRVRVEVDADDDRPPVNGSDAVFAAVAAAAWLERGLPTDWPTERGAFP